MYLNVYEKSPILYLHVRWFLQINVKKKSKGLFIVIIYLRVFSCE